MIRNITLAGILISSLHVNAYSKNQEIYPQIDSILQTKGLTVDNGFQENFDHSAWQNKIGIDVHTSSKYTNIEFNSYSDGLSAIDNLLSLVKNSGFKVLSHCSGLTCGNALALATNIMSDNFLSEKEKQEYILLYNDYSWITLHLSSYEDNTFIFYRRIFEKKLEDSLELLFIHKDNFQLSEDALKKLNSYIPLLNASLSYYTIIGHTDNSGSKTHNQNLGKKRAMQVYEYLVSNGVNKDKLKVISAGEDAPLHSNQTSLGRELNRRVELIESKTL